MFWIYASNATRFELAYRDIAEGLNLPGRNDPKTNILSLVSRWLSNNENCLWLMIIDSADDDTILVQPDGTPLIDSVPQTKNGSVIVTSRSSNAAINLIGEFENIINVEPMEPEEALNVLKNKVPFNDSSNKDAETLVQSLEYIPLAITHAGSYIRMRSQRITIFKYLQMLKESEESLAKLLNNSDVRDLRRDHSARNAVLATWQISFEQIRKSKPESSNLLALMSMFDRQGIPEYLLQHDTSQAQFEDAVAPLINFSLIKEGREKSSFEMHRLVQVSTRDWLELNNNLELWTMKSLEIMARMFPEGDYETWVRCQALFPHAKEVMNRIMRTNEGSLHGANLAHKLGRYLMLSGDFSEAEVMHRRAIKGREKVLGLDNPDTLAAVSNLSLTLERQGNYKEAEAICRQILKAREKTLGLKHLDTITTVNNLGSILWRQGRYLEAEQILQRALKERENILGLEHPDTFTTVSNLA